MKAIKDMFIIVGAAFMTCCLILFGWICYDLHMSSRMNMHSIHHHIQQ